MKQYVRNDPTVEGWIFGSKDVPNPLPPYVFKSEHIGWYVVTANGNQIELHGGDLVIPEPCQDATHAYSVIARFVPELYTEVVGLASGDGPWGLEGVTSQNSEKNIQVVCVDLETPGPGGACHSYQIVWQGLSCTHVVGESPYHVGVLSLKFQNGVVGDDGARNGVTEEALISILIHRLECFQRGSYPCPENEAAIMGLTAARGQLHARTEDRIRKVR